MQANDGLRHHRVTSQRPTRPRSHPNTAAAAAAAAVAGVVADDAQLPPSRRLIHPSIHPSIDAWGGEDSGGPRAGRALPRPPGRHRLGLLAAEPRQPAAGQRRGHRGIYLSMCMWDFAVVLRVLVLVVRALTFNQACIHIHSRIPNTHSGKATRRREYGTNEGFD